MARELQNNLTPERRAELLVIARKELAGMWVSFPTDGFCTRCGEDLIDRHAWQLSNEPHPITGCVQCHRSFCE